MSEPASVQLPRVNVSTLVGVAIPVLVFIGALMSVFYTYVMSKAQVEFNQAAMKSQIETNQASIEKRMDASDAVIRSQTAAIRAIEDRLAHMDDTIANLKIQATPKH